MTVSNYSLSFRDLFSNRGLIVNEENRKLIWKLIQETGDKLQPHLKPSPFHPKGRNAYAHIALCIKEQFGYSYKDVEDSEFETVKNYINFLLINPN